MWSTVLEERANLEKLLPLPGRKSVLEAKPEVMAAEFERPQTGLVELAGPGDWIWKLRVKEEVKVTVTLYLECLENVWPHRRSLGRR